MRTFSCAFFGHRDCPPNIRKRLEKIVFELHSKYPGMEFMVGSQGDFDSMVLSVLKEQQVNYTLVLAYIPGSSEELPIGVLPEKTLYPEGMENVPKRYAIAHRNRWMANRADVVVCYITHSFGGAAKAVTVAQSRGIIVINLAQKSERPPTDKAPCASAGS